VVPPREVSYKTLVVRCSAGKNRRLHFQHVEKGHLPSDLHRFSGHHYCFDNPDPVQRRQYDGRHLNAEGISRWSFSFLLSRYFGRPVMGKEINSETFVHSSTSPACSQANLRFSHPPFENETYSRTSRTVPTVSWTWLQPRLPTLLARCKARWALPQRSFSKSKSMFLTTAHSTRGSSASAIVRSE
jgi:hypothetical protein